MSGETRFVAFSSKHGGPQQTVLDTDQLNEDQVQPLLAALEQIFPTKRFTAPREGELDPADALVRRDQCREAARIQRYAPFVRHARMRERSSVSEIRTIREKAEAILVDLLKSARAAELPHSLGGAALASDDAPIRDIPDPIENHVLARLAELNADTVSSQIRQAITDAGKAFRKVGRGQARSWSYVELKSAFPGLPESGKLKKFLQDTKVFQTG